jgi:hypothetical protein
MRFMRKLFKIFKKKLQEDFGFSGPAFIEGFGQKIWKMTQKFRIFHIKYFFSRNQQRIGVFMAVQRAQKDNRCSKRLNEAQRSCRIWIGRSSGE